MLSHELESRLDQAFQKARSAHHELLTTEHLLLAILDAPMVREVLKGCSAPCCTQNPAANCRLEWLDVLVSIFSEKQSQAVFLMKHQGVTRTAVVDYVMSMKSPP